MKIEDNLKKIIKHDKDIENLGSQLETKATKMEVNVERKRIDSFTNLAQGSTTGDAELIDGRVGCDGVTRTNIGDSIRNQITNGYNLTRNLPISDDKTTSYIDGKYYAYTMNFNDTPLNLASVYTGIVNNVIAGTKYRVKVYTLGDKTLNFCSFYNSNDVLIPHGTTFYNYTVIDSTNKIVEFTAPPLATKMTYTGYLSEKSKGFCKSILTKLSINWLEVNNDNLDNNLKLAMTEINNGFTLTTTNKISSNKVKTYDWGYYLGTDGRKIINATMGTSYFDVLSENTYRMKVYSVDDATIKGDFAVIYFWDKNGARISPTTYSYTIYDNTNKVIDIIAPVGAVSGTITYRNDTLYYVYQIGGKKNYDWLLVNESNLSTDLQTKININLNDKLKYSHSLDKPFNFTGKTVMFFGDSITAGSTSPSLAVTPNPYCKIFADKLGMNYSNQAVGGTCICDTASPNSILNKVINYTTQKDFIIIAGGTNDWTLGKPVGVLGDTTGATFYGALYVMCQSLKTNNPNAKVIFITPINQNVSRPNAITTMDVYRNAIFEVATSNGFSVVDGSKIGFPKEQGAFANIMCSDGVHPSDLGHQFYAKGLLGILA